MESNNILAVNVPNAITVTIMAVVGLFLIGLASKAVMAAKGGS